MNASMTMAIILTWIGVLVFAITISIIRRRRLRQGQTSESSLDLTRTKKEKRHEIAKELLFTKVKKTTTNFKRFETTRDDGNDEDTDIEKGRGARDDKDTTGRGNYSNACAICLEEFEEGEKVVRSVQTKGCPHIFHESCMEEVISAAARKVVLHVPCPCCRQTFVEIDQVA